MKKAAILNKRNSNIEVLRIISMLMIIAYHVTIRFRGPDYSMAVNFTGFVLGSWGQLGVDLFLIISAWFLTSQDFRLEKVISIVLDTLSWFLLFLFISVIVEFKSNMSVFEVLVNHIKNLYYILTQPFGASLWWFVTAYVLLLITFPLLNKLILSVSSSTLKKILICFSYIPIYSHFHPEDIIAGFIFFPYIYLLVGYIKKYGCKILDKFSKSIYIWIIPTVIIVSRIFTYLLELKAISIKGSELISSLISITFGCVHRFSIIILAEAFLLFFWILKIKPRNNQIINTIASCTLGIYIFHCNGVLSCPETIYVFEKILSSMGLINYNAFLLYPLQYIMLTMIIFVCGFIIEYLNQMLIQKPLLKIIKNKYKTQIDKVNTWYNI